MFSWLFNKLPGKKIKAKNGQQQASKKHSQKVLPMSSPMMAWSAEKQYQQEVNFDLSDTSSTPVSRVDRILNFADDAYVNALTNPNTSPCNNSVETPHSGESNSLDGGNSPVWDVSVAICDGAEESDDDIEEVEEEHNEAQSVGHLAAIKADALGLNSLSNSFRKPSLPPLSFSKSVSNQEEDIEQEQSSLPGLKNESMKKRRGEEEDNEETVEERSNTTTTLPMSLHNTIMEVNDVAPERTAVELFNELGERPEDSSDEEESSDDDDDEKDEDSVQQIRDPVNSISALPPLLPSLSMNDNDPVQLRQPKLKPLSSSLNSLGSSLKSSLNSVEKPKFDPFNTSFNKISFKRFDSFESFGKISKNNQEIKCDDDDSESFDVFDGEVEETPIHMIASPLEKENGEDIDVDCSSKVSNSSHSKKSKSKSRSRSRSRSKSKSRGNHRSGSKSSRSRNCRANSWEVEVEDFQEDFEFVEPVERRTKRAIQL